MRVCACTRVHVAFSHVLISETIAGVWLYLYQEGTSLKGGRSPPGAGQAFDRALREES